MHRVLRILVLALIVLLAVAPLRAADETPRQTLDAARATLADIDNELKATDLTDADLARLRALNDPLAVKMQAVIAELAPRLEASRKRLAELKPKTKDAPGRRRRRRARN